MVLNVAINECTLIISGKGVWSREETKWRVGWGLFTIVSQKLCPSERSPCSLLNVDSFWLHKMKANVQRK